MILTHIITSSLVYALILNGSLFIMMVSLSPCVWAYSDYPDKLKAKVPPQTRNEKRLSVILGIPWIVIMVLLPMITTYLLKNKMDGEIPFWIAFLNISGMVILANLVDLSILDGLIVCTITPKYVIIPGTDQGDYKNFSYHLKAHARSLVGLLFLYSVMALFIWLF